MVTSRDRKSFGSSRKNSESCSDDWHLWRFWSAFRHFGTHFAESFRMSKCLWMMDATRPLEMPSCSAIDLAEIQWSSMISSWIWSKISRVVTVLDLPGRGASQVEKSPRLNWTTHFLTVVYDGACPPNVFIRMAWISFGALLCRKKNLDNSSRLHVVEIARVAWHASFQPLQQEKTCNSAHEQTPLSNDTIDSVLRHRELGRAKDLTAPPRTFGRYVAKKLGIFKYPAITYSVFKIYGIKWVIRRRHWANRISDGLCRSVMAYIWRESLTNVRNCWGSLENISNGVEWQTLAVLEDVCPLAFHSIVKGGWAIENILYSTIRKLK